jgi:hypothetical protein
MVLVEKICWTFDSDPGSGPVKYIWTVLWNRNYFLRFRIQLLKSYSYGSGFRKSYGSGSYFRNVTVPVPAPYLDHKKLIFSKNF